MPTVSRSRFEEAFTSFHQPMFVQIVIWTHFATGWSKYQENLESKTNLREIRSLRCGTAEVKVHYVPKTVTHYPTAGVSFGSNSEAYLAHGGSLFSRKQTLKSTRCASSFGQNRTLEFIKRIRLLFDCIKGMADSRNWAYDFLNCGGEGNRSEEFMDLMEEELNR